MKRFFPLIFLTLFILQSCEIAVIGLLGAGGYVGYKASKLAGYSGQVGKVTERNFTGSDLKVKTRSRQYYRILFNQKDMIAWREEATGENFLIHSFSEFRSLEVETKAGNYWRVKITEADGTVKNVLMDYSEKDFFTVLDEDANEFRIPFTDLAHIRGMELKKTHQLLLR